MPACSRLPSKTLSKPKLANRTTAEQSLHAVAGPPKSSFTAAYAKCSPTREVCGNEFQTRAVVKELKIEICSVCHPFYTGNQKFVDAAGRVDRFNRKFAKKGKK